MGEEEVTERDHLLHALCEFRHWDDAYWGGPRPARAELDKEYAKRYNIDATLWASLDATRRFRNTVRREFMPRKLRGVAELLGEKTESLLDDVTNIEDWYVFPHDPPEAEVYNKGLRMYLNALVKLGRGLLLQRWRAACRAIVWLRRLREQTFAYPHGSAFKRLKTDYNRMWY